MMNLKKGFDWAIKWSLVKGINIFHCFISLIYLVFEYYLFLKVFLPIKLYIILDFKI